MKKTVLTDISHSNIILKKISTLLFLCMLLFFSNSNAQGTTCATAETLAINGTCDANSITDATLNNPAATGCGIGTVRREGWYTFTVTGGPLNITITGNAANNNLALQLVSTTSNCAGTLAQIACANTTTTNGAQTETITQSLANGTYYLKVLNVGTNANMTLNSICVTAAGLPPANATCATATTLPCATTNLAGTTIGTTGATANGTGCSMSDYGVWYTFVGDGQQTTISSTATFDHEMSISSGSCGTQTSISCNDTALSGGTESYTFTTVSSTVYYVYIAHYLNGSTTTGTFTISRSCTPAYNPCATIPNIAACGTTTNLTVAAGNGSYGTSACGFTTPGREYIYTFTAATTGTYTIQQLSSFGYIDYQFKLVSGGCSSTGWTCIDDLSGAQTSPNFSLIAGNQYYILLDPESTTGGNVSFIITCGFGGPANDNCTGAIALTVNPSTSCVTNTAGTTVGATQSQTGCLGTADDDVWYSFVATSTSHIVTVVPNSISDIVFQVFSGTCGSLSSINCVDNNITATETSTFNGLTIGVTYFVRIYSWSNSSGQGTFTVCVTSNIPCTPGSGNGTTTLACPAAIAGGLGLSGGEPLPTNPCNSISCTDLEVTYSPIAQTTSYSVSSIPYAPPYQFNCLQNNVSVNVDDVWSPIITLPFNFCFFGNTYNQCLIGSNGVITFDVVNNPPNGYNGWPILNNIPSATLPLNTIFGVYHDIDPSISGQVGWELVTLNNGCRALIAAWNQIPMFSSSCNSMEYSGMIVLYENTNVIEVYIREKNVCASWNSGNAVVGIQNATGTTAYVAPNRNSLDPDWAVLNEAWRFTPNGTSSATVSWYEGAGTSGPLIGTGTTITVCPSVSTTYTAAVNYTLCTGQSLVRTAQTNVTVDGNKIWNGSVSSNWNNNNNWTPFGTPSSFDCVIIPITANNPIISGTNYVGLAGTLTVLNGATLTVLATNTIAVTKHISVGATGIFNINDDASLVQINNPGTANTGNIRMYRDTNIRALDYVYWSSPVSNFPASSVSPLSPTSLIWKWNPTHNGTDYGIWVNGNENMALGRGYIIRGPSTYTSTPAIYTATFEGVPNNGNITTQITRGTRTSSYASPGGTATAEDDNWNLIGNPYPSALDAISFITANTNIDGNIRLWTHGQPISTSYSDPFYADYVYNYSVNDYITYNSLGSTPPGFLGKIGAGQSFFVQMNHSSPTPSTVVFNNTMRSSTYSNSQFYRNSSTSNDDSEKSRIWLNIVNTSNNQTSTTLVGYVNGATYEKDRLFDAFYKPSNIMEIYSFIEDKPMIINGRPMPFDQNDMIPIGITTPIAGSYSIGILDADGLFENTNQMIYLKDNYLETIHDLRQSPYTFTSESGNCSNRFILRYTNGALNNLDNEFLSSSITTVSNNFIEILSAKELLDQIVVYDILGRKLADYKKVNSNSFTIKNLLKNNTTLLLEITTENGNKVNKKIIY